VVIPAVDRELMAADCDNHTQCTLAHCMVCYPEVNGRDMKLNTHLHVVLKLRMGAAVPVLPLYAFMTWTVGVVVKALRYKPAGRAFDSRWCHWNFSVT
jgi:hypothetical protein